MSTPASITCVEIQSTFSPPERAVSKAACNACMVSRRCAWHIDADRWKCRQGTFRSSSSRNAASSFRLHTTSRLSQSDNTCLISCGISFNRYCPALFIFVRLNTLQSASCHGTISGSGHFSGCCTISRLGWVAEQSTIVVPHISDRKFTARLKSVSILFGTV